MKKKEVLTNETLEGLLNFKSQFINFPFFRYMVVDVSRSYILTNEQLDILDENKMINWEVFSGSRTFDEVFLRKYKDKLNWSKIIKNQKLSEPIFDEMGFSGKYFPTYFDEIIKHQKLSDSQILKLDQENKIVDHYKLATFQKISEQLLQHFIDKCECNSTLIMNYLCIRSVSTSLFEKYIDHISIIPNCILYRQNFSFEFIEKYNHKIRWDHWLLHEGVMSLKFYKKFLKYFPYMILHDIHVSNQSLQKLIDIELLIRNYIDSNLNDIGEIKKLPKHVKQEILVRKLQNEKGIK